MIGPSIGERGEIAQPVESRQEEVATTPERGESRYPLVHLADRSLGNGEIEGSVLRSADRVVLVAWFLERLVVDPYVLRELELAHQVGTDDERSDAAVHTVVGCIIGQRRAVGRAAPDHPAAIHVVRGITWIQPPRMRPQW